MSTQRQQSLDFAVLQEMVYYITQKCQNSETWGSTQLNKLLYYSDFIWFANHGKSLSGDRYIRRTFGPTPKRVLSAEKELKKKGVYEKTEKDYFNYKQKRPVVTGEMELKKLSDEAKEHIDIIIEKFSRMNARELSDMTHMSPAVDCFENGEEIPYEIVYFLQPTTHEDLTKEDLKWAREVIKEYERNH